MKKRAKELLGGLGVMLIAASASAQTPEIEWDLEDAVRQIDSQADNFETAMARIELVRTDSEGKVLEKFSGNGFIRKNGDMRYSEDGGDRIVIVDNRNVSDYDKAASKVHVHSLSRNDRLEPFFRLGFSIAGRDMKKRYLLTILGEEQVDDGRALVLELTPERKADREVVGKIRLWIDQASWMPRRQEFSSTADGTTTTLHYTTMARNLKLNPDLFQTDWPRGTERVKD